MQRHRFLLGLGALFPFAWSTRLKGRMADGEGTPFKVNAGEARSGKRFTMRGVTHNTLDLKVSGADNEGAFAVFEQIGHTPHGGPPLHVHLEQDEWFHVLEGEYLFQCGEERWHARAGDTVFLPRQVPHAFVQLTERARTLVCYQPAGAMESFFSTTDQWTAPPSQAVVAETFAAHGMQVVGGPLRVE